MNSHGFRTVAKLLKPVLLRTLYLLIKHAPGAGHCTAHACEHTLKSQLGHIPLPSRCTTHDFSGQMVESHATASTKTPLALRRPDEKEVNVYTRASLEFKYGGVSWWKQC